MPCLCWICIIPFILRSTFVHGHNPEHPIDGWSAYCPGSRLISLTLTMFTPIARPNDTSADHSYLTTGIVDLKAGLRERPSRMTPTRRSGSVQRENETSVMSKSRLQNTSLALGTWIQRVDSSPYQLIYYPEPTLYTRFKAASPSAFLRQIPAIYQMVIRGQVVGDISRFSGSMGMVLMGRMTAWGVGTGTRLRKAIESRRIASDDCF